MSGPDSTPTAKTRINDRPKARRASPPVLSGSGLHRGRKHRCAACGAAFYDLERELPACPKCETPYAAAPLLRSGEPVRKRQSWNRRGRPVEAAGETEAPAPANEDDDGVPLLDDGDDSIEEKDEAEAAEGGEADAPDGASRDPDRS